MKTLHLGIIIGLCIAITISLFLVVTETTRLSNVFHSAPSGQTVQNPETVYWGEGGMKHTYVVGQKINFEIELHGYGSSCLRPDYAIKNQDGIIIWHSHQYVSLCDPQIGEFDKKIQFAEYNPPMINETGLYWLMGTYENQTGRSPILVTLKPWEISDNSPLDICNQIPNLCHVETLEVDSQTSQYVEVPLLEDEVVPIKLGGVTLYANGAKDTQIDGIDCSKFSPKIINVVFGHHSHVTYDGYFEINGTKHFAAILPNGTTSILKVCWPASNMKPIIHITEDNYALGVPIFSGYEIKWFDENKTVGIMLHDYSQSGNDYYNKYVVKLDNKRFTATGPKITHYYDGSAMKPKVELYDYYYDGIDKDNATVSINDETYYQTTLNYTDYDLKKGTSIQFQNVTFAFPEGVMTTPGGAFIMLDIKFPDGSKEIYGENKKNPDGSGALGGIEIPTQYGPHLATNSTTVIGNHVMPQAGMTIYDDKIKLLVSIPQLSEQVETAYTAGPRMPYDNQSVTMSQNNETNSLTENNCGQFYTVPQDNRFYGSETYPVLILKENSVGCAKLTYTINYNYNDNRSGSVWPQMLNFTEMFHMGKYLYTSSGSSFGMSSIDTMQMFKTKSIPEVVDLAKYPVGSQFTVTLVIKPLPNATGFYDYSVEELPCDSYPLAVGHSLDQVNSYDFSKGMITMHNHSCANIPYEISSVQVSGMDFKLVKFS